MPTCLKNATIARFDATSAGWIGITSYIYPETVIVEPSVLWMNTKAIGLVIAFTALAAALNLIKIPVVYNPYFNYQLGDIIFVIAFLLFGLKIGFAVVALNMMVSIAIMPSIIGVVGGPYYMVAVATMVLGVYLYEKTIKPRIRSRQFFLAKSAALSTAIGVVSRTLIMLPLDYFALGFLVSVVSGLSLAEAYSIVLFYMPSIVLYNIIVPLYVIPTSYFTANKVNKHMNSPLFADSMLKR